MKHALIIAHPNPGSFTHAIAAAYRRVAIAGGDTVLVRDLYAMDWDPRLAALEVPDGATFSTRPDNAAERLDLADVDTFAFFYPWWFNSPPAILKGYVDRVFSHGFGFRPTFGGMEPALTGRGLISFSVSGAPDGWIKETSALVHLKALFDHHLCLMCGMTLIDHVHFGGVISGMTREAGDDLLVKVDQAMERHFPALRSSSSKAAQDSPSPATDA